MKSPRRKFVAILCVISVLIMCIYPKSVLAQEQGNERENEQISLNNPTRDNGIAGIVSSNDVTLNTKITKLGKNIPKLSSKQAKQFN